MVQFVKPSFFVALVLLLWAESGAAAAPSHKEEGVNNYLI